MATTKPKKAQSRSKTAGGSKKKSSTKAPAKQKRALKVGQIERTKNAVLDATVELLGEVAYGKLTVELISERSGASRSTIYRYWNTVPDLVSEAFDHAIDPDPPLPEAEDLRSQLVILFSELPKNLDGKTWGNLLPSLVAASHTDDEFSGRLQAISDRRRRGIRHLLQQAINNGEIRKDTNIEWVVDALSATFYLRHLITGTSLNEKGHVEWLVNAVYEAIKSDN